MKGWRKLFALAKQLQVRDGIALVGGDLAPKPWLGGLLDEALEAYQRRSRDVSWKLRHPLIAHGLLTPYHNHVRIFGVPFFNINHATCNAS
jgi:hypothetical protein